MSERSTVFMFSGQGSQYYQMGRRFFDANAGFRNILLQLSDVAKPLLGRSIIDVLYDDGRRKDELFDEIKLTSAAIFIVEYALARVLIDDGVKPDYLLASSMGIYAAAAIAAAADPREVLKSVIKLAAIYETRCRKGAMITILGNAKLHGDISVLRTNSDIAAVNFDGHFVISTTDEYLDEITAVLLRENFSFQKVAVSYPFHSRWIDDAREPALAVLEMLRCRQPMISADMLRPDHRSRGDHSPELLELSAEAYRIPTDDNGVGKARSALLRRRRPGGHAEHAP